MVFLGLVPRTARFLPRVAAFLMVVQIPVAVFTCLPAFSGRVIGHGAFVIDGIGAAFTVITTLVAAAAMVQAALILPAERKEGHKITDRRFGLFYTLSGGFILAMYAVPISQNIGYLWIAVEATTLMSAPLINFHHGRDSLEATWKYLLLCSVGIAFALFGTILILASQHAFKGGETMMLNGLLIRARDMDPRLVRLGFIFCLLGYGTKAGIFPLHNWLPDAHSESPAPVSAMLSGALLNCALVAIWRLSGVVIAAGQGDLVRELLVPAGAITVIAASVMLIKQHDLKRMLAYSSVEHVGLLTLAIGIGSGQLFMLHAFNHSIVKVALFLMAGGILHIYGTKELSKLGGLLRVSPAWGIVLAAGGFAVAGSPPFGTFISEWLLLRDTVASGAIFSAICIVVGLTITFIAIATHVGRVVFGQERIPEKSAPAKAWALAPALLLAASLVAGVSVSMPVMRVLNVLAQLGVQR